MKKEPFVSIILLNYNQLEVTIDFLRSCEKLSYHNYEIILVDNHSKEDPSDYIKEHFPQVRLIVNNKNLGFTGGNNVGIRAAKGEYLFIVNNDTEVTVDLIERLLEPFEIDLSIGIVSPKIKFFSQPEIIQFAGFNPVNPYTGRNSAIGSLQRDQGQYDKSGYTPYAHGAAMMVKREVFEKAGIFPEHFFIYYEELDFSARAGKAGYKVYYQGSAVIYHKESVTMGKESPIKAYYHNRNRIMFMRRNSSGFQLAVFLLFYLVFTFPKNLFAYLIKLKFKHMLLFLKGIVWNIVVPKRTVHLNNYLVLCR